MGVHSARRAGGEFYQAKQVEIRGTDARDKDATGSAGSGRTSGSNCWDAAEREYRYFDIRSVEFGPDARCDFVACP